MALEASLVLPAAGEAGPATLSVPAIGYATPHAPPRHQYLRVNDTLRLEVSRPYATFTTYNHPAPTWLWQRAELRGSRGYRQRLTDGSDNDLVTLYGAWAGASVEPAANPADWSPTGRIV